MSVDALFNLSDPAVKKRLIDGIQLLNGRFNVRIAKVRKGRTYQQLKYLFGGVYPAVADGLSAVSGEIVSVEDAHIFCKGRFLGKPIVNKSTGEVMGNTLPTTKTMTVEEFSAYIDNIAKFSAEYLSIIIPDAQQFV